MSTYDDGSDIELFDDPQTAEATSRRRRRVRPPSRGGPRRPAQQPQGAVALARLAGLVALAIAVVVGLVFWVDSCQGQSKHDEYASYMNSVQPIAQSSASALTSYANLLGSSKLTLPQLQTKLDLWSRQQQEDYNSALRLVPPASLQAAHQEVLATLQLRAIGLAGMANKLATAGSKSPNQVGADLAGQAKLLSASDLVWSQLFRLPATETMKKLGVIGVIAPPSQIVANPAVISPHSFSEVYSRLHATNTNTGAVTGIHGSQLVSTEAVSSGKTTTLSTSGPTTVNVAADLVFKVTFTDAGNFQEAKVPVTLKVSVFKDVVVNTTQHVPVIQKGQTVTVTFRNLNIPPKAFGNNATVTSIVGRVPGETNLTDNHASYPVFFSLPSG